MATSWYKNTHLVAALTKALGLEISHVKSVEIAASVGKFSTAKVEFLIPEDRVDAVAEAVAENAGEIQGIE